MIDKIKKTFTDTLINRFWSFYKSRQQEYEFSKLLKNIRLNVPPSPDLPSKLDALKSCRRRISHTPRVVALGHRAWEMHGLWPSFERMSEFHLEIIDDALPIGKGKLNPDYRYEAGQKILGVIDRLDLERSVEIVFIYCGAVFLDPEMLIGLSKRGIWSVLLGLDDKHAFKMHREYGIAVGQSAIAPLADLYWTTWKAGLPLFWGIGARPVYLSEGADPHYHKRLEVSKDIEVLFLGQRYGPRKHLVEFLESQGFNVATYGRGWPNGFVSFDESIRLINRSEVVLGIGGVGHMSSVQHLKGRDFEIPMCGAAYLTTYNPELADWFEIGKEILCYSSPQNCAEVLHWILRDPEKLNSVRHAALERSLNSHTWEHRLQTILKLLPRT